jgi:large-conductance mechanosensitive channel
MEKLAKFKFIPFILGLAVLIAGICLKYILHVYVEYAIIKWGIFLTVAGFIFLRAIQQTINEKLEKEKNHGPEKTVQEIETNELRDELYQIKNRGFPASFTNLYKSITT